MKILIADDHVILREGLIIVLQRAFPDFSFIEASNGIEALSILRKEELSLTLLDITMPELNGIDVLKQARALGVETPIIMVSLLPEDKYAIRVLKAGAQGFLNKDSQQDTIITAVKKVLSGQKYISPAIADMLANSLNNKSIDNLHELLSDRELQVLQLIAQGMTVSKIAGEISLSVNTISTYRSRILQKMNLKNNADLLRYAIDNDLA